MAALGHHMAGNSAALGACRAGFVTLAMTCRPARPSSSRRVVCMSLQQPQPSRRSVAARVKPGETPEQALERRLRESAEVMERVVDITGQADWDRELAKAGDKLVVLNVQSDTVCQTGLDEAELQWKADQKAAMEPCSGLKHSFARVARDSKDVVFLSLEADTDEGSDLCDQLGVDVLPTVQFWKGGVKVWEHRGVVRMDQTVGEGVLYYGDTAANNVKASSIITELESKQELQDFVAAQPERVLTVVDVSLLSATPCVHIYPAVLALATNFVGYAAFARLLGDDKPQLLAELDIKEVPTFIFYRNGQEVGRHVGSSRGDLIGQILAQQAKLGIQAPPPPGSGQPREKRPMRRGRIKLDR